MAAAADIEDLLLKRDYAACDCFDCGACCTGTPGAYDPAHIQRMLDEGMTMAELASTMSQHYSVSGPPVLILRPRTVDEKPGAQVPLLTLPGKCVHLGANGCALPRDHMPIVCISSYCCEGGAGAGRVMIDKGHLREPWASAQGREIMRLFEEESARQTPGVKLGHEALEQQMDNGVVFSDQRWWTDKEQRLRYEMKQEARHARGQNMPCDACDAPTAQIACKKCDRPTYCSDACEEVGGSGHPWLCWNVEQARAQLVQDREEILAQGARNRDERPGPV